MSAALRDEDWCCNDCGGSRFVWISRSERRWRSCAAPECAGKARGPRKPRGSAPARSGCAISGSGGSEVQMLTIVDPGPPQGPSASYEADCLFGILCGSEDGTPVARRVVSGDRRYFTP